MAILSVDLAYKRYTDVGAVILEGKRNESCCELIDLSLPGPPSCEALATWANEVSLQKNIQVILLDGPQGWKSRCSPLPHCRACERQVNAQAKTGCHCVKPASWTNFVNFSIQVYDALASLGWMRLGTINSTLGHQRLLVESYPFSAWRSLGLKPLPSKRKKPALSAWVQILRQDCGVQMSGTPTHDQLQAVVAGLAALAIEADDWGACSVAGTPPIFEDGYWCEGYIVNPRRDSLIGQVANG